MLVLVTIYGISQIQINDNPTRWFKRTHPIRVADRVLNEHFGGTYMAYLALFPEGDEPGALPPPAAESAEAPAAETGAPSLPGGLDAGQDAPELPEGLGALNEGPASGADSAAPALPAGLGGEPEAVEAPAAAPAAVAPPAEEVFKDPEVLRYIADLQAHLRSTGIVGKSNSLTDIVKTVHRELPNRTACRTRRPPSRNAWPNTRAATARRICGTWSPPTTAWPACGCS